jgi:hypothetical protein
VASSEEKRQWRNGILSKAIIIAQRRESVSSGENGVEQLNKGIEEKRRGGVNNENR